MISSQNFESGSWRGRGGNVVSGHKKRESIRSICCCGEHYVQVDLRDCKVREIQQVVNLGEKSAIVRKLDFGNMFVRRRLPAGTWT